MPITIPYKNAFINNCDKTYINDNQSISVEDIHKNIETTDIEKTASPD